MVGVVVLMGEELVEVVMLIVLEAAVVVMAQSALFTPATHAHSLQLA